MDSSNFLYNVPPMNFYNPFPGYYPYQPLNQMPSQFMPPTAMYQHYMVPPQPFAIAY